RLESTSDWCLVQDTSGVRPRPAGTSCTNGRFFMRLKTTTLALAMATALSTGAFAADPETCKEVTFSDVGWTDITATTATASVILDALGYEPKVELLAVPVT